jgi:copper chaperone NosL
MRKQALVLAALVLCFLAAGSLFATDDIKEFPSCKYCGMDRAKFNFSRTYIDYADGKPEGFCSLHCMAVDLAVHIDRIPKALMVGDFHTKELIDAEKASWVVGGSKPGVMSKRAKWAFATKEGADRFVKESGGVQVAFEQAMEATYEDMYQDTKMIRERRALKRKAH